MMHHLFYFLGASVGTAHALAAPPFWAYKSSHPAMGFLDMMLGARQDHGGGYKPDQSFCGTGVTCTQACGQGFEQCTSSDDLVHCYNPAASQTCCMSATGDSCDGNFYCAFDANSTAWCCQHGRTLDQCAQQFGLPGGLTGATFGPVNGSSSSSFSTSASVVYQNTATPAASTTPATTLVQPTSTSTSMNMSGTSDVVLSTMLPVPVDPGASTLAGPTQATTTTASMSPTPTEPATAAAVCNQASQLAIVLILALVLLCC